MSKRKFAIPPKKKYVMKGNPVTMKPRYKTVEGYISLFPRDIQEKLQKIRGTVKQVVPEAEETISYNMPAFKFHGTLVYFAVHTKHIGFYPFPSAIAAFKKEASGYETSKGSIQFPLDKPIPYGLIRKIVRYRVDENMKKKKV